MNMIGVIRERVAPARPKISRGEVLAACPLRNSLIEWEWQPKYGVDSDEETTPPQVILLKVPRRSDRWGNLVAKWFKLPEFRKVELDEMGSDVWEKCDGNTNVEMINREICQKYRLNKRQGEVSVTAYLKMLADRRFIQLKKGSSGGQKTQTAPSSKTKKKRK
jgi:hypothetical protein